MLAHGVEKSADQARNLALLPYDDRAAASQYGFIRAALERQGTPIGDSNLHIAGHVRSLGLIIVTNNLREFERVPGISVKKWV